MLDKKGIIGNINTMEYNSIIRSNARLVDAARKTVQKCPSNQQVEVCIVLIADWGWTLETPSAKQIPEEYREAVKAEIGLV